MKILLLVLVLILLVAMFQLFVWFFQHRKLTRIKIESLKKTQDYAVDLLTKHDIRMDDNDVLIETNREGVALYRASLEKGGKNG